MGNKEMLCSTDQAHERLTLITKALDSSSDAIGISDSTGRHFYQNRAFSELLEFDTAEELLSHGGLRAIMPDENVAGDVLELSRKNETWSGELTLITKTGLTFEAFGRIDAIVEGGSLIGYIGVITGWTDRKREEDALKEVSSKNEALLSAITDTVFIISRDGTYLDVKSSNGELPLQPEEMIGKNLKDVGYSDVEVGYYLELYDEILKTRKSRSYEYQHKFHDTNGFYNALIVPFGEDKILATVRNITEQKMTEEALKKQNIKYNSLLHNLDGIVYHCKNDKNWTMEYISDGCLKLTGYKPEDLLENSKLSFSDIILPDYREYLWDEWQQRLNNQEHVAAEYEIRTASGEIKWVWEKGHGIYDQSGRLLHLQGYITDITDRKRAEQEIIKEKTRVLNVLEGTNAGSWEWDLQTNELLINSRWVEIIGYTLDEFSHIDSNTWSSSVHPEDLANAEVMHEQVFSREIDYFDMEFRQLHKDGYWVWIHSRGKVVEWSEDGKPLKMSGTHLDITERKWAEATLKESEEKYRTLFHNARVGLFRTRVSDGMFLEGNQRLAEMFGYDSRDELRAPLSIADHYADPEARADMIALLKEDGEVKDYITRFTRVDGSTGWVRFSGTLYKEEGHFEGIVADITESKRAESERIRLEEQYRQAQKVEAIGRLAAGVAHDMNNLLTPILGFGEILMADFSTDDRRGRYINQIVKAGYRSRDLVRQLLAFGRKQTLEYRSMNLNNTIQGFEKLLRRTIREDIILKFIPARNIRHVNADIGQIEQVLMNLAVNAQDAMPGGGMMTLETSMVEIDKTSSASRADTQEGSYVMLAVSDNGCGMDEETQEQIFEPFFSTKGDQGTGLGLATVYGIIKQHGGNIWAYSEPGEGTTIKIYLPVSEEAHPDKTAPEEPSATLHGSETILLVEDNRQVRELGSIALTKQGYTVLTAANGAEALKQLELHDGTVHLLLTDVIMPGMNGKELFNMAAEMQPELKILYMSGYTDNVIAQHGVLDEGVKFIQKPFTAQGLSNKVLEVLN